MKISCCGWILGCGVHKPWLLRVQSVVLLLVKVLVRCENVQRTVGVVKCLNSSDGRLCVGCRVVMGRWLPVRT